MLNQLRGMTQGQDRVQAEIDRRIHQTEDDLARLDYGFDRRFIFRVLAMGHSQFAEYIGARGPNTHVNAACATTTHAVAVAEDWIRTGRCRRVIVIAGDDVTSENLMEWIGSGLLATGATTIEERLDRAALPFDQRRNGTIIGMGAAAIVLEAEDAVRERGMRGICELLSSQIANSAYHGTRLDVDHICAVMDRAVGQAEERFGIDRREIAAQTVFVSHETYTPARGGSAAAEIHALRRTFGDQANQVVIANTKGYTGHAMGVGIEDVLAIKVTGKEHRAPGGQHQQRVPARSRAGRPQPVSGRPVPGFVRPAPGRRLWIPDRDDHDAPHPRPGQSVERRTHRKSPAVRSLAGRSSGL